MEPETSPDPLDLSRIQRLRGASREALQEGRLLDSNADARPQACVP